MKQGDVVQLNSGGSKMTVTRIAFRGENDSLSEVTCSFFDGQGEMDTATLPIACLKPATEAKAKRTVKATK